MGLALRGIRGVYFAKNAFAMGDAGEDARAPFFRHVSPIRFLPESKRDRPAPAAGCWRIGRLDGAVKKGRADLTLLLQGLKVGQPSFPTLPPIPHSRPLSQRERGGATRQKAGFYFLTNTYEVGKHFEPEIGERRAIASEAALDGIDIVLSVYP
jgi:hypothetical protein